MIELKLNREQFSDYCRRSPNKSLKTTEEWLLFRVLARVNVALRRNRWYHEPEASSERLFARFPSPSDAVIL